MLKMYKSLLLILPLIMAIPGIQAFSEVRVMAPAVAQTSQGWVGVPSYITIWTEEGEGGVFVDTYPFTQVDTQGSARLAADVAASIANVDLSDVDIYVKIRSDSPVIGGPSAGGTLAVAILASLLNRSVDPAVVMTGTVNPDGSIGPIGGVVQKAEAAHSIGARAFLVPMGQTQARENPNSMNVVDVEEYAREHWNLTVHEIEDVREAAKYMLGIEIKRPGGGEDINLEKYNEIMNEASQDMLDSARDLADRAKNQLDDAGLGYSQEQHLRLYSDDSLTKIEDAESARDEEEFYRSASLAFQSKINATYVINTLDYLGSRRKIEIKNIIDSVEERVQQILSAVNSTSYTSVTAFECYAAGEKRIQDAYQQLDNAYEHYYQGYYEEALHRISYIEQRAESALWWTSLCQEFEGDADFNRTVLRDVAQQYIADVEYLIAYAESMGTSLQGGLLSTGANILDDVRREFEDGAYAAAILGSLDARSYVNAHLELAAFSTSENKLAEVLAQKVEREREMARSSISNSREFGVNPILALSHLEFGESFADQVDPDAGPGNRISGLLEALLELRYARLIAEMSPIISDRLGREEGDQEKPVIEPYDGETKTVYKTRIGHLAAAAVVFLAIGLIIGSIAGRHGGSRGGNESRFDRE